MGRIIDLHYIILYVVIESKCAPHMTQRFIGWVFMAVHALRYEPIS